ncbi:hypothetical protein ABZX66_08345 [Micromonospora aurantiaca]|uniref:hypothetical protein n=1 Tax=Micromonospora aurantiaca (nom. illeg.) TaxID=47850 RepID=UPI001075B4EE
MTTSELLAMICSTARTTRRVRLPSQYSAGSSNRKGIAMLACTHKARRFIILTSLALATAAALASGHDAGTALSEGFGWVASERIVMASPTLSEGFGWAPGQSTQPEGGV